MPEVTPPIRSLFATKTAVAQYIQTASGLVAVFWPPATEFVAHNAAYIVPLIGILNLTIRAFTHGRVALVANPSPDGL
jgi:hypothetical protein